MREMLFIVSSDAGTANQLARPLRDRGWEVELETKDAAAACWRISQCRPIAVVIPLDIDPEGGCDFACALSVAAETRDVPVIFVGGSDEQRAAAAKVRRDAAFISHHELPWVALR